MGYITQTVRIVSIQNYEIKKYFKKKVFFNSALRINPWNPAKFGFVLTILLHRKPLKSTLLECNAKKRVPGH